MTTKETTRVLEGIAQGFGAVAHFRGDAPTLISVYDDGDEIAFIVSPEWTVAQINQGIGIFQLAFRQGEKCGAAKAQNAVRVTGSTKAN